MPDCQSYQQSFNKLQQNLQLRYNVMENYPEAQNDPKWHSYWFHNGGPDMSDDETISLYDEYKNPIGPSKIYHLFLTIALPNLPLENELKREKVFEDLQKLRNIKYRYLKKKDIKVRFEFFSVEPKLKMLKDNYHIHLLAKGSIKPFDKSRIIRDFKNLMKVEANFIDVKYSDSPDLYLTRVGYMNGDKRDTKLEAVEADAKIRSALNLEELISLDIL